jgi:hypothetical protein
MIRFSLLALFASTVLYAQTSITFDTLNDGDVVTTQYSGVTFSNAQVLRSGFSLNEIDFPAHSGANAITDASGPISIAFSAPVSNFSGYFTHAKPITITAFDGTGNQLAVTTSTKNNAAVSGDGSAPNELLSLAAGNIAKVVISGSLAGNSVVADDISYASGTGSPGALQLITVAPCRVIDTRNANGPLGGPFIAGHTTRTIPIPSSSCGVPANATAWSLNITVVPRNGTLGFLTVWPTGQSQPGVSTLNSPDGSVLANAAIVPAGLSGAINAFATDNTDLIVDINGYFAPPAASTLQFYPLFPCRVLDTRNPAGTFGAPAVPGGGSRSFPIPSSPCGAPANSAAYSFNVTVVPHGELGYLTAWPTGGTQPYVSTLNSIDGTVLANAAIVPAGTGGAVSFYAANTTDLIVDINGYFAAPSSSGLNFYAATPCRLVDTRNPPGSLGGPSIGAQATRAFPLSSSPCGLPGYPSAQAYSLNMTVVPPGPLGYITTWPTGGTQPGVSTLNALKGLVVANAAIVPASNTGSVSVFAQSATDVIIDTNGYFGP